MNIVTYQSLRRFISVAVLSSCFFFIFVQSASAAITLDAANSATVESALQSSLTWSHTVAGSDRVLVVGVSINGNGTVSSVTYGGSPLIRIATREQTTLARASLWYMVNPPAGTANVIVTMGQASRFVAGSHSYTGVHQANPISVASVGSGTSVKLSSLNVASAVDELVVGVVARRGDRTTNPITAVGGQTQVWNTRTTLNNNNNGVTGGGSYKPGATTVNLSWTWPTNRAWVAAGVSLKPTPTGDTTPPLRFNLAPSGVLPVDTTSETLSVETDENATCKYDTSTSTAYASMSDTFTTTGGTTHSESLSGLTNGSSYTYYVRCIDGSGNTNNDDEMVRFSIDSPAVDATAPSIPDNLTATSLSPYRAALNWDPSTDNVEVTGYKIFRDNTEIGTATTGTTYIDEGLTASTSYSYTVSAFDAADNESAESSQANVTTLPVPTVPDSTDPSIPTNLYATATSQTNINLSWVASTDNIAVTGYKIFRDSIHIFSVASTSFSDTGLTASTSYSYTVSAFDAAGNESAQSGSVSTSTFPIPDTSPPLRFNLVPANVLPDGTTDETLSVETDENATCKYDTSASTAYASMSGTFTTTGNRVHSEPLSGLADGSSYTYYVRCIDGSGNANTDDESAAFEIAVAVDVTAPSVPIGLVADTVTDSQVTFSWDTATDTIGVQGYRVFRDGDFIGSTIATTFTGVGVLPSTSYSYTVSAFDAADNESAQSAALNITTSAASNATVTEVLSSSGGGSGSRVSLKTKEFDFTPTSTVPSTTNPVLQNDTSFYFTRDLSFGVQDNDVRELQKYLATFPEFYPEGLITGYFGVLTQAAVQRFQCAKGIICSGSVSTTGYGRVGPRTRTALNNGVLMPANSPGGISLTNQISLITSTLRFGMSGHNVITLQTILAKDTSVYPEGLITGYFGELTRAAVRRFQCTKGIACEGDEHTTGYGLVGPRTRVGLTSL